jgi:hypothetical protein
MGRPRKGEAEEVIATFREVPKRETKEVIAVHKSAYIPQLEAPNEQPAVINPKRHITMYQVKVNGALREWTAPQIEVALKDKRLKIELPNDYVVSNETRPCKNC